VEGEGKKTEMGVGDESFTFTILGLSLGCQSQHSYAGFYKLGRRNIPQL